VYQKKKNSLQQKCKIYTPQHTAPRCTTLHHTAPHCNTLQHIATHRNTLQHAFRWGANKNGELGHGDVAKRAVPRLVKTFKGSSQVSLEIVILFFFFNRGSNDEMIRIHTPNTRQKSRLPPRPNLQGLFLLIFTHLYSSLLIFTHLYSSLLIFTHLYSSLAAPEWSHRSVAKHACSKM